MDIAIEATTIIQVGKSISSKGKCIDILKDSPTSKDDFELSPELLLSGIHQKRRPDLFSTMPNLYVEFSVGGKGKKLCIYRVLHLKPNGRTAFRLCAIGCATTGFPAT